MSAFRAERPRRLSGQIVALIGLSGYLSARCPLRTEKDPRCSGREIAVKLVLDHGEEIRSRWAHLLLPGEQILAAEFCRSRGKLARTGTWSLVESLTAGANTIVQAAGALASRGGESVQEELGRKRRHETAGEAGAIPFDGIVLAVTDRRYLIFRYIVSGLRHRLEPLAVRRSDWITGARITSRVVSDRVQLTFRDGSSTTVEMTKGLGNARKLVGAITTLRSTR